MGLAVPRRADVRHQPGAPSTAPERLSPPQVMVEHPPFCVWDREVALFLDVSRHTGKAEYSLAFAYSDLGQFASEEGKAAFDLLLGQAMHNKRPAVTGFVK